MHRNSLILSEPPVNTLNKSKNTWPFGGWKSPISSELITSESVTLDQVRMHRDRVFWLERRPSEAGRSVIVGWRQGTREDMIPQQFNARSRVHEYGGGVYCPCDDGVYFVNNADQDIYLATAHKKPERISQTDSKIRYADLHFDRIHNRLVCVCEDHRDVETEAGNSLASIDVTSGKITTICQGYDFYSSPRTSPDGSRIASGHSRLASVRRIPLVTPLALAS